MSVAHPGAASTLAERMATDCGGEEWDRAFVGELRVSVLGLPVCWDGSQGCLITRLFEV